eukprot:392206-Lingulodinium_polyedra.AAC.1
MRLSFARVVDRYRPPAVRWRRPARRAGPFVVGAFQAARQDIVRRGVLGFQAFAVRPRARGDRARG